MQCAGLHAVCAACTPGSCSLLCSLLQLSFAVFEGIGGTKLRIELAAAELELSRRWLGCSRGSGLALSFLILLGRGLGEQRVVPEGLS